MTSISDSTPDRGHDDASLVLGQRLRRIRHQQAMSLADVEAKSGGQWKAVVIGAYERGDRAISIVRLARLAAFYGVPVAELLPSIPQDAGAVASTRLVLNLGRLAGSNGPGIEGVRRFANRIRRIRGDHNGRVLTVRSADVDTIALAVGEDPEQLIVDLREHGALLER